MAALDSARILVTGASGLIGRALLPTLQSRGFQVVRLVRHPPSTDDQIAWDPFQPLTPDTVSGFHSVVHLAGETVVGQWTESKKTKIRDSRVIGTRNLSTALAKATVRPRVLIAASAVGYYGDRGDEALREDSSSGSGFLAEVCREWEAASQPVADAGIRVLHMRTGVALSSEGGALQKMLPPFRMGVGGVLGSGKQWMSWIHIQDLVGAIHHMLKTDLLHGPVNMTAPKPVTNAVFTKTLGTVLSRPTIFPVPAVVAKLAFGQMAEEVLLASQRAEPEKLISSGYPFQYTDLSKALESLLGK